MTTKKKAAKPKKPFYKTKKLIILAIIIAIPVVYIGWHLISQKVLLYKEQQEFLSTKQAIDSFAHDLKTKLPQYNWQAGSSCNTEYKEAVKYTLCTSSVTTNISISTAEQGHVAVDSFMQVLATQTGFKAKSTNYQIKYPNFEKFFTTPFDQQYSLSEGIYGDSGTYLAKDGLECGTNYAIQKQDINARTEQLSVSLSCSDSANEEWF